MICCSMHAKSTKNRPIECCRQNLCPPNRRPRKWCHNSSSASVGLRRSSRARNVLLPLTPALSPHRRGEGDYMRGPRHELDQLDYAVGGTDLGYLYDRKSRSDSRCASFSACSGVLVPVSAACNPSLSALVTRWLSCVESSAFAYGNWSRATTAGGKPETYCFIAGVSHASARTAT